MDTVRLLNFYRKSILTDPDSFNILSVLYRDRTATISELAMAVGKSEAALRATITNLYQSNLLSSREDKIVLTEHADGILTGLGLRPITVKSFIPSEVSTTIPGQFLSACIEAGSSLDQKLGHRQHVMFRALKDLDASGLSWYPPKRKEDYLFVLVVGLNPEARSVRAQTFVDSMIAWEKEHHDGSSGTHDLSQHRQLLVSLCKEAVQTAKTCDAELDAFAEVLAVDRTKRRVGLKTLTNATRFLTTLFTREPDPWLSIKCLTSPGLPGKFTDALFTAQRTTSNTVSKHFINVLRQFAEPDLNVDDLLGAKEALDAYVRTSCTGLPSFDISWPETNIFNAKLRGINSTSSANSIVNELIDQISSGKYDNLSPRNKERIVRLSERLLKCASDRFQRDAETNV